jgi:hypothetical protein
MGKAIKGMDKAVRKARSQLIKNDQIRFNQACASAINNQALRIEQLEKKIEDAKIKNRVKKVIGKIKAKIK